MNFWAIKGLINMSTYNLNSDWLLTAFSFPFNDNSVTLRNGTNINGANILLEERSRY